MLEWMQYSLQADVQAETAEYYGAAASNTAACPILRASLDKQFDFGYAVDTVRLRLLRRRSLPGRACGCGERRSHRRTTRCGRRSGSRSEARRGAEEVEARGRDRGPAHLLLRTMSETSTSGDTLPARGVRRRTSSYLNTHHRTRARPHAGDPAAVDRRDLPRGAVPAVRERVLARRRAHRAGSSTTGVCRTSTRCGAPRSTERSRCARSRSPIAVTIADVVLAFPLAYYAARLATPRVRALLLVAVVLPLWSSYLVKAFAWQTITAPNGLLDSVLGVVGIPDANIGSSQWAIWLTFTYLWLPFVDPARLRVARADPEVLSGGVRRPRGAGAGRRSATSSGRCRSRGWSRGRSSRSR